MRSIIKAITTPSTVLPADLTPAWLARLSGYAAHRQTIGKSPAAVFRLERDGMPALFLKTEPAAPLCELPGEVARLRWLATQGQLCPEVLDATQHAGTEFLLMSAVAGRDMASSPGLEAMQVAVLAADALKALHRLDPVACPFDHRAEQRIPLARARLDAGLVDTDDFDTPGTPEALFTRTLATQPAAEDLVVTHGDACLPNLMAEAGRFTGFLDCGRLGVADRYQDIALACRSIEFNFGSSAVEAFLARYGIAALDGEKLAFYRLLDNFF